MCRKWLYTWLRASQKRYVFSTRGETPLSRVNAQRDFRQLCRSLGISGVRCSPHTARHSFAANYIRQGGNIYYLSRVLGHASVQTTEVYLRSLGIQDLQRVHDGLSLLKRI